MKHTVRSIILLLVAAMGLSSCQKTNFTDLITYRRIPEAKVQDYQKTVTLSSTRNALVLDSLDHTLNEISLAKGTKITVLALRGQVGSFKTIPVIFSKKYDHDDVWLAELKDGRRVYVQVPELISGPEPLYSSEVAIYLPHRHFVSILGDEKYEDLEKTWQKALFKAGKVVDFATDHNINRYLYKDASFYKYMPLIKSMPQWLKRAVQAILSFLLLGLIFFLLVPWLSLNAIWHIRFIPNWLVKILCAILCYVLAFFIGGFMGLTAVGFILWGLMLFSRYVLTIRDDVDFGRCPYCHHVGIDYNSTEYGEWHTSRREWDKEEVKSVSQREYDNYTGVSVEHVKETINHMGVKHYVGISSSRSVTEHLYCPHCRREITLHSTEGGYDEKSNWK